MVILLKNEYWLHFFFLKIGDLEIVLAHHGITYSRAPSPFPSKTAITFLNGSTYRNTGCTLSLEYWLYFFHSKINDFNIGGMTHSTDIEKVQPVQKCSQYKSAAS
jgi:hypothetical protein